MIECSKNIFNFSRCYTFRVPFPLPSDVPSLQPTFTRTNGQGLGTITDRNACLSPVKCGAFHCSIFSSYLLCFKGVNVVFIFSFPLSVQPVVMTLHQTSSHDNFLLKKPNGTNFATGNGH
jgi:hypothetical protein